jgi:thioredoxin 1
MNAAFNLTEENFDQFIRQATQPVVVDFWAEWCGPCKMLAPVLEGIARERQGEFVVAQVNIDKNPALAQRFNIQSIPTLLYFRDGAVRDQTIGAVGRKAIVDRLAALLDTRAATPAAGPLR